MLGAQPIPSLPSHPAPLHRRSAPIRSHLPPARAAGPPPLRRAPRAAGTGASPRQWRCPGHSRPCGASPSPRPLPALPPGSPDLLSPFPSSAASYGAQATTELRSPGVGEAEEDEEKDENGEEKNEKKSEKNDYRWCSPLMTQAVSLFSSLP